MFFPAVDLSNSQPSNISITTMIMIFPTVCGSILGGNMKQSSVFFELQLTNMVFRSRIYCHSCGNIKFYQHKMKNLSFFFKQENSKQLLEEICHLPIGCCESNT